MKNIIIILWLFSGSAFANCQGCCSSHGGVMCSGGSTMCGDGSGLSATCSAKGCNACGGVVTPPTPTYYFYYADRDGDGYGDKTAATYSTFQPSNYVTNSGDCDDTNPVIHTCETGILKLDYDGFTIWLDCARRGAIKFQYNLETDSGNAPRLDNYYLDPQVSLNCQQVSVNSYGNGYDRGHLVPANHLDATVETMASANVMTNILPQAANMNRGAWLRTEEIAECYRDTNDLQIIGGVLWGDNSGNDYFLHTHGLATPDAFWKVIIRGGATEKAIGWIIPNAPAAKYAKLDSYIRTIQQIELKTGETIATTANKSTKPKTSWAIPAGCKKD